MHHLASGGWRHTVWDALKELLSELILELGYLHVQGRLHDVYPFGYPRNRAFFKKRDEVLNLLEIHIRMGTNGTTCGIDLCGPCDDGHDIPCHQL